MMGGNPKPAQKDHMSDWKDLIPGILNETGNLNNKQILWNLQRAANAMQSETGLDYWNTDEGQAELLRRLQADAKKPDDSTRS